ncbi:hypothetical protein R1sor_022435 [Riccia sorocarpa]|uniref:Uncharacterized protein n=1 Tax=Riccia sorocarpa TaxID=122646 RepID=A0ABD3GP29_9MARC
MPEVIQYQDPEDVESQEESEHVQSQEGSEHESASRSSGEREGVDEELDDVDDEEEEEDLKSLDFADLGTKKILTFGMTLRGHIIFPRSGLMECSNSFTDKPDRETAVEETAVEDVSSSDEEDGSKKKKKPKKKSGFVEPLPSQVVTSLHRIYCEKHGEELPERLEPFAVLHLHKDISQYQLTLDEKLTCKLVFLDLTHPDLIPWEKQQFSSFLSIVRELTVATEFVIVSVMEFGQQLVNFSSPLNDMKDARALLEYGAYKGDRSKREVEFSYPCWQLVYTFVNLGPQDYKPVLVENPKLRPFFVEFEPKHANVERQVKEGDQPTNIKMKTPRWEFVGMDASGKEKIPKK